MRNETNKIILHAAATTPSMDIGAQEIDRWHRSRGWLGIGYHFVIRRDGQVETGRRRDDVGAHAKGHNHDSIGVCLVGGLDEDHNPANNFTDAQFDATWSLIVTLEGEYGTLEVIGHSDVSDKTCPMFDVDEFLAARRG